MSAGAGQPGERRDVATLCHAVRQATDQLWLDASVAGELQRHLEIAEQAAGKGTDVTAMLDALKVIRYHLLESADGPLAPFLADAAAQIIGDGHGRLFI